MRILVVTHLYPPQHTAGVEVFAHETSVRLCALGHDVTVLTTHKDIGRGDLTVVRRRHEGVPVVEITNNLFLERFEQTWERPELEALVAAELDRVEPDVVHVHHLMGLSVGVLKACKARGIPVAMTLHDFWLGCGRFGQLLHADGSRCAHVDVARCGTCLPSLPWRQSDGARCVARALHAFAGVTRLDLGRLLRAAAERRRERKDGGGTWIAPRDEVTAEFTDYAEARRAALVDAVNEHVDAVILPARFMVEWFEILGIDRSKMVVETTGVDWEGAREHPRVVRQVDEPVRVTFLGTLVPHKGAHVLLDAWESLPPEVRSQATLALHGPDQYRPHYVVSLRERAEALGVTLTGRLSRDEVRRTMARTDVLVCPSLWFEIRPLVMLEAYAAGARVIATDLGGMGEAVRDGLDGVLFPEGDAAALARALESEIERSPASANPEREPSELFRDWSAVTESLVERYEGAVRSRDTS